MDQDPRVTKYIRGPWKDKFKHRTFIVERMNTIYPKGMGYWSVFKKDNNQNILMGWVLLLPYYSYEDEVEIGWRFNYETWEKGYATEAATIILHHAFNTVKLEKMVADINPLNVSSIAVAKKMGMKYVEDRNINKEERKSYQINNSHYVKR